MDDMKKMLGNDQKKCLQKWERSGLLQNLPDLATQGKVAQLLERQAGYMVEENRALVDGKATFVAACIFPIIRRVFGQVEFDVVTDPEIPMGTCGLGTSIPKIVDRENCYYGLDAEVELCERVSEEIVERLNSLGGKVSIGRVPIRIVDVGSSWELTSDLLITYPS